MWDHFLPKIAFLPPCAYFPTSSLLTTLPPHFSLSAGDAACPTWQKESRWHQRPDISTSKSTSLGVTFPSCLWGYNSTSLGLWVYLFYDVTDVSVTCPLSWIAKHVTQKQTSKLIWAKTHIRILEYHKPGSQFTVVTGSHKLWKCFGLQRSLTASKVGFFKAVLR